MLRRVGANIFGFRLLIKLSILVAASSISLIAAAPIHPAYADKVTDDIQAANDDIAAFDNAQKDATNCCGNNTVKSAVDKYDRALVDQSDLPEKPTEKAAQDAQNAVDNAKTDMDDVAKKFKADTSCYEDALKARRAAREKLKKDLKNLQPVGGSTVTNIASIKGAIN